MSAAGPELPPHLLTKRKRKLEEEARNESATSSGAKPSPGTAGKRRIVVGPAPPPAPLDERPEEPVKVDKESSDEDDDFGPTLPSADRGMPTTDPEDHPSGPSRGLLQASEQKAKPQRDDWMLVPPKQDDLAARFDPTKQRARKFNTGKGSKGPAGVGGPNDMWSETPEQKRKRLEDEMMGVSRPEANVPRAAGGGAAAARHSAKEDEDVARKMREHTEKARAKSLLNEHQKTNPSEREDDPSKRAFDREKDIGGGIKIGHAQRREMLDKASNFSSKFSGGSYL